MFWNFFSFSFLFLFSFHVFIYFSLFHLLGRGSCSLKTITSIYRNRPRPRAHSGWLGISESRPQQTRSETHWLIDYQMKKKNGPSSACSQHQPHTSSLFPATMAGERHDEVKPKELGFGLATFATKILPYNVSYPRRWWSCLLGAAGLMASKQKLYYYILPRGDEVKDTKDTRKLGTKNPRLTVGTRERRETSS
jgi:hypothetical protein